jgi:tetratricopeptide (TPR) repeat protein
VTADEWSQVKAVFDQALDLEEVDARARFVAAIEPESIRAEVQRLLSLHESESAIFDRLQPDPKLVRAAAELRALNTGDLVASRFRIVRFVAEGGMGEVYEAHDEQLNERVAVKTLRFETAQDSKALARFRQEIQLARRVTNPNVCRIHDLWEHKTAGGRSIWFLTMEFLEGETLAHRIERGAMSVDEALPIVQQMAAGLGAAHDAGIVHRDFKSSNVILVPRVGAPDRAVVTDFGLSRSFDVRTTASGAVMGTPAYMAPEQIEGGELGPATDLYALGVVMYEMLTGMLPFRSSSPMALAVKKLRETPVPPGSMTADVPAVWDQVVMRCLQYRMADRFRSAKQVVESLTSGELPPVRSGERGTRTVQLTLPVSWWRFGWAAVLLIALLGGWIWWARKNRGFDAKPEALSLYEEGVIKIHDGAPQVAVRLFRKSIEIDPEFVAARARLAQAFTAIEMVDASRNELLKIPPARLASLGRREQVLVEASRALALNDSKSAVTQFREYLSLDGSKDEARLGLADAYLRASELKSAIELCDSILVEHPGFGPALLIRARAKGFEGRREEAVKDARSARDQFDVRGNTDGKVAANYVMVSLLSNDKNVTETEKECRSGIDAARAVQNTYYETLLRQQLANAQRKAGRYAEAEAELGAAGQVAREQGYLAAEIGIQIDLARLAFAQSQLEIAEQRYRHAVELAVRHEVPYQGARAQMGLADTLIRSGRSADGLKALESASKYFSDRGMGSERLELARLGVDSLIAMNENALADSQADSYLAQARNQNAKGEMERALKQKAHLRIVSGEIFRVFDYQHQAMQLVKSGGKTIGNDLLNEARLHIEIGDADGAERTLKKAEAELKETYRSKLLQNQARLAAIRSRWPEAEQLAQQARDLAPNEVDKAEINVFLARLQSLAGRTGDAEKSLAAAEERYGRSKDLDQRLKYESARAEVLLSKGKRTAAADLSQSALKAYGDRAQRLAVWQCALVGAAADPASVLASERLQQEYVKLTVTWPAEGKQWLRARGDLRHLYAQIERK